MCDQPLLRAGSNPASPNIEKRRMLMKKSLSFILAIVFILFSISYADEPLIVPHTFQPGTPAKAEDMNEVIEAIRFIMNKSLVVMYDYGTPANTVKTFAHTASPTTLTSVITEPGIETWEYEDGSKVEHLKKDGPEGTLETGRRMYNTFGELVQDLTYFPAVIGVDLAGTKEVGKIWGNAYVAKKPDGSMYGTEVNMYSIIGIEDITVPAGTFANCTKVFHTTGNYKNVAWYAAGVGMVKRIGVEGLMELQGYVQ